MASNTTAKVIDCSSDLPVIFDTGRCAGARGLYRRIAHRHTSLSPMVDSECGVRSKILKKRSKNQLVKTI
jgi:hypothetical protein